MCVFSCVCDVVSLLLLCFLSSKSAIYLLLLLQSFMLRTHWLLALIYTSLCRVWLLTGGIMTQVSLAAVSSSSSFDPDSDSAGVMWASAAAQQVGLLTVLVFGPLFLLGELKRERRHEEEADAGTQGELRPDVMKLSGDKEYDFRAGSTSVGGL